MESATILDQLLTAGLAPDVAAGARDFVVDMLVPHARPRAVILAGSIGAGLGNAGSDIDFLVLLDAEQPPPLPMTEIGGQRVDVWLALQPADIDQLVALCATPPAAAGIEQASDLVRSETRTLAELLTGPVLIGRDHVEQVRARFSLPTVVTVLVSAYAVQQAKSQADAMGALRSGHWATALEAACITAEHAAEIALIAAGDFYPIRKFIPARLQRLGPWWYDTVAELRRTCLSTAPDAPAGTVVLDVVSTAVNLQAKALAGLEPAPSTTARPDAMSRNPFYGVVPCEEGFMMLGPRACAVSPATTEIWLASEGRTLDEVAELMAHRWGKDPEGVRRLVDTTHAALAEARLLGPATSDIAYWCDDLPPR